MNTKYRMTAIVGCIGWVALGAPAHAADGEKSVDRAVCADSYRNAQLQRKNGSLRRARESLLLCASDKCPSMLQPDCMRWLTEVEAAMPSIAFAAKDADGKDVTDVRVTMDGQSLRDSIDGKAVNVDPGTHVVRFEHGSETAIEQTVVVREGEKARVLAVSWAKAPAVATHDVAPAESVKTGPSTAAWVFGGVGVASLATFGALGLHGMSRRSSLHDDCYGTCSSSQVDSVKTEFLMADIALGVGIASLGVATVLFLTTGGKEQAAPSTHEIGFGLAPKKDGAAIGMSGRF